MPRDGFKHLSPAPNTDGVPNAPIESDKYNANVADVEQDLNLPRPDRVRQHQRHQCNGCVVQPEGPGTATQIVTNWDSQIAGARIVLRGGQRDRRRACPQAMLLRAVLYRRAAGQSADQSEHHPRGARSRTVRYSGGRFRRGR